MIDITASKRALTTLSRRRHRNFCEDSGDYIMTNHQHSVENAPSSFWRSKTGVLLIMLVAISAFYVVREHFSHVSPYLPYLILLICPLMHFFGHGHGGHGRNADQAEANKDEDGK